MAQQTEVGSADGTRGGRARLSGAAIASLAGGGLLVAFMVQNRDDVTVRFLFWSSTWPLWLLVLVSAVLGGVVWIGVGVLRRHRRRKARRAARAD
ncbi:lipopolysaccharide assembly protein LapA domain-containing protein [Geodermatophilus sp. SYSU D00710]